MFVIEVEYEGSLRNVYYSFIVAVFSFITTAVSYLMPSTEKQLVIYFMIFIITSWMKEVR